MNTIRYTTRFLVICFCLISPACGGGGGGSNPVGPGPETYSVSGTVTDVNGNGVPDVTITFTATGQFYTKTTNLNGYYSLNIDSKNQATFTISASLNSYDITPASQQVIVDKNITEVDFSLESTIIRFEPVSFEISGIGQTYSDSIMVDNVSNLITAAFTIQYDPAIIEVTEVNTSGASSITYDNEHGRTTFLLSTKTSEGFPGPGGTGKLARVTFKGKSSGSSQLIFVNDGSSELILGSSEQGNDPVYYVPLPYKGSVTVQ